MHYLCWFDCTHIVWVVCNLKCYFFQKEELFTKLSDEELSESLDKQLMGTTERANITEWNIRMLEVSRNYF